MNELAGRLDETAHKADELQSTVAAVRTELEARLDQLARAQAAQAAQQPVQAPPPPPLRIPDSKADHFAALEAAFKAKDYAAVRTLGHEYVNRYATDEKGDDALYWTGKANLEDGRPASALGEWNRLLKLFPKSNMLEPTLFGMGQATRRCTTAPMRSSRTGRSSPTSPTASSARRRTRARRPSMPCPRAPARRRETPSVGEPRPARDNRGVRRHSRRRPLLVHAAVERFEQARDRDPAGTSSSRGRTSPPGCGTRRPATMASPELAGGGLSRADLGIGRVGVELLRLVRREDAEPRRVGLHPRLDEDREQHGADDGESAVREG